jgi:hypothetical protein
VKPSIRAWSAVCCCCALLLVLVVMVVAFREGSASSRDCGEACPPPINRVEEGRFAKEK